MQQVCTSTVLCVRWRYASVSCAGNNPPAGLTRVYPQERRSRRIIVLILTHNTWNSPERSEIGEPPNTTTTPDEKRSV